MKINSLFFIAAISILLLSKSYGEETLPFDSYVKLPDTIKAAKDVSAIAKIYSLLVIGSDEGAGKDENKNYIQLLKKGKDDSYKVHNNILLFKGNKADGKEMDIEGITVESNYVYIIGSHSSKRKKVNGNKKYKKNREKFKDCKIEIERSRDRLYRLMINSDGIEVKREMITLREIIKNNTVLKTFGSIPGKENGVDIEGVAAKDGWLYIGFRGPVFRGNYVPIMKLKFDAPERTYELLYINLGGLGIRDMAGVSDGFLILAGPVGDSNALHQLYH